MTRLLISAALVGLLAFSGSVMAQGRGDDHRQGGGERRGQPAPQQAAPQQAAPARPAPTPGSRPGGVYGRGYVPAPAAPAAQNAPAPQPAAPARNAQNGNNQRGQDNNRLGQDNRGPNSGNDRRSPDNNDRRGFNNNDRRGSNNDHRNFSGYHRAFNAPRRFHAQTYRRPPGWYSRRWSFGEILPALFWAQDYWLNDYFDYGLDEPPPGTVWVRDGGDAILIDRFSGEIIEVEYGVFY
jgi:Ni/Co efflux regulator RcnB